MPAEVIVVEAHHTASPNLVIDLLYRSVGIGPRRRADDHQQERGDDGVPHDASATFVSGDPLIRLCGRFVGTENGLHVDATLGP